VLPHPNADRLEILRFEMKGIGETTYEVVSQKGTFQVGDLASYFSVDCLLPTSHPDFRFLTERPDGKGKETYRLRAARLRGVFSQGLLVPCPSGKSFGEDVAKHFGVTYYSPPEVGSAFTPGQPGKKPKKQPFPIYGVDSLKKLPRLFEEGEPVVVTEKIHGTNFRFGWVRRKLLGIPFGWKFVVGSHRTIKEPGDGSYYGEDLYTTAAERMGLAEKTKLYKGHTFYGELYGLTHGGANIQDLTYGRKDTGLVIFDVLDDKGKWFDPFMRMNLCAELALDHAPVISGPLKAEECPANLLFDLFFLEDLKALADGPSLLAPKQIREGVVVESVTGPRRKAKFVGQGYLLRKEA
jgi:RNA ligase (TIGR02306 family)